ncbi:lipocalin family protein [Bacteroides thetaiotaomicron]|uniref:lipocalin family protein n=1 Tax=Bacteroides thetaiotaomicron TaxID=818 RepID=UPI0039B61E5A
MKTLRLIGTTLLMVVLCLNFTACGDDDEEDNRPLAEKLIGHWVLTYEEGFIKDSEYPDDDEAWSHAPKDECEYFGNFTFRADGTYSEYDLDGTSNPQSIEKWSVNGNVITLIEDEHEQYDLKVLEITSDKLVLEHYFKDESYEVRAKMTYKRG